MGAQFIPGTASGWDLNNDGVADIPAIPVKKNRGQEVKMLNQYTGYFSTDEGDFPVSVVANSIKEAAKILTMPGVYGADSAEPTMIKFVKSSIGVSIPVHTVGFSTVITPSGAVDSGAYATPVSATVENGTDVIFTAYEPFGWKFAGWYKGDPDNGGTAISTSKVTTVDVYDAYSSLVTYYAKYTFDPSLRNGRYMDVARGYLIDLKFDGYSNYKGRFVVSASKVSDYYFVMQDLTVNSDGSGTMTLIADPTITQPENIAMTLSFSPSYVGINCVVTSVTTDNSFGYAKDSIITLKYVA